MEEGLETNIQTSYDNDDDEFDDVMMDIHPNPPMMITHPSIMRERILRCWGVLPKSRRKTRRREIGKKLLVGWSVPFGKGTQRPWTDIPCGPIVGRLDY
eukprot:scaffold735_cov116-Cylindrotheca_fusiformis.AAC.26